MLLQLERQYHFSHHFEHIRGSYPPRIFTKERLTAGVRKRTMLTNEILITDERINQNFYCISENFTYFLRSEVALDETVDPQRLAKAVESAFKRFPYFSVTLRKDDRGYYVAPNDAPHIILCDDSTVTLNSPEVNGHLIVVSYLDNKIIFNICHCITDGRGVKPFILTVLYHYLSQQYGLEPDSDEIYLRDTPFHPDENVISGPEAGVPSPAESNPSGNPSDKPGLNAGAPKGEYYRLSQNPKITDSIRTEYRFTVDEAQFMELCRAKAPVPIPWCPLY